jgi:hypothetical protein
MNQKPCTTPAPLYRRTSQVVGQFAIGEYRLLRWLTGSSEGITATSVRRTFPFVPPSQTSAVPMPSPNVTSETMDPKKCFVS